MLKFYIIYLKELIEQFHVLSFSLCKILFIFLETFGEFVLHKNKIKHLGALEVYGEHVLLSLK